MHISPHLAQVCPGFFCVGVFEGAHDAARVAGVERSLEEAVHQTARAGRVTQLGFAGSVFHGFGPVTQLRVGQAVEVGALGQVRQRLFVGHHLQGVGHQRNEFLGLAIQLAHAQCGGIELAAAAQLAGQISDVLQCAQLVQRRKLTVQRQRDMHLAGGRAQLGLHACEVGVAGLRDKVHGVRRPFQNDLAHFFGFFHRRHLGGHDGGIRLSQAGEQQGCCEADFFEIHGFCLLVVECVIGAGVLSRQGLGTGHTDARSKR